MEIKEYKCPNCSGAVKFDSSSQKLKCPYCDAEFEIAPLDEHNKEMSRPAEDSFGWRSETARVWESGELADLGTGSCPSCGAELVGNANTIAMVCPCCGNAQIVTGRLEGLLKPEYIIPFKLEKKDAVAALKKFYEGKRLLPDLFREENRVNAIQGLYVPFWLFDAKARGRVNYRASKITGWSDSRYNYTKTDHFSVVRDGSVDFEKIPVDASEKMDDAYMDALEPFDYASMKDFEAAFLAGFTAEKYDVDAGASKERANTRIKNTLEAKFAETVKAYSSVVPEKSTVNVEGGKVSYALLPVWILNTKYKDKTYRFMMNGQTGRLAGKLPVDRGKSWKYRLMFTFIFGAAFTLIVRLLRLFM